MLPQNGTFFRYFHFWHEFFPIPTGSDINLYLKRKYLAYILLLAGWLWFCFWFYGKAIYPKLNPVDPQPSVVKMPGLEFPLAYAWGSDVPLAGDSFDIWISNLVMADSLNGIMIWRGYYYQDEAGSHEGGVNLVKTRIEKLVDLYAFNKDRMLIEIASREISSDVRSKPIASIDVEVLKENEVLRFYGDTAEICFPIADSLKLPPASLQALAEWGSERRDTLNNEIHLTGTADGTGIAESSDMAIERANYIKDFWLKQGLDEASFQVSAGQRSSPHPIRNRCVMIYFKTYPQ